MRAHALLVPLVLGSLGACFPMGESNPAGPEEEEEEEPTTAMATVAAAGAGSGRVTSSPAGIDCVSATGSTSGSCQMSVRSSSRVTLSASPAAGSVFEGWSGACSGTATCTLTMAGGQSVTATFGRSQTGGGGGGGGGAACTPTSTVGSLAPGQSVTGTLSTSDCLFPDGTYFDLYRLTVPAARTLQIDLTSSQVDAYLILYSADGTSLASDDDGGGGTNSRITRSLSAGTYLVAANSFGAGEVGSYRLSVSP